MAARGRSKEQFAHVEVPIADALLGRARGVLTGLPLGDNGYVQWMLAGRYLRPEAEPAWIRPEGQKALAAAADRIRFVHGRIQDVSRSAGPGAFSAFGLSDVPEYLSVAETADLYEAMLASARPGARIAYWNLFVPRSRPEALAGRIERLTGLATELHARDRAFVYGGFQVERVT